MKRAVRFYSAAVFVAGWSLRLIRRTINSALPATVLGRYPELHGSLQLFDLGFGLALVAYGEEVVFRRCARSACRGRIKDGWVLIVVSSLLFAGQPTRGQEDQCIMASPWLLSAAVLESLGHGARRDSKDFLKPTLDSPCGRQLLDSSIAAPSVDTRPI